MIMKRLLLILAIVTFNLYCERDICDVRNEGCQRTCQREGLSVIKETKAEKCWYGRACLCGRKKQTETTKKSNLIGNDWEFMQYVKAGNIPSAKFFLNYRNVNVNSSDENGWTPLMYVAKSGNKDMVDLLLSKKADVNIKNNNGKTAIDIAKDSGHEEIANTLEKN